MKTKKSAARKARAHITHKKTVRQRPVHKRILLHPISGFLLLCVGVLVAGSTFRSQAATYDVTAEVHAPLLSTPAVIAQPTDQQHVTTQTITVEGTCPDNSYVNLYREGVLGGNSICSSGHFSMPASLSLGGNGLQVRVFNVTNDEGPASSAITVYYDLPAEVTPPSSPPTSLQISNVEQAPPATGGEIPEITANPTISGLAPPFSDVTVTFYSDPTVCKTKADSQGVWTCTLPTALPPGIHHVVIEAVTPSGKKFTLPTFQVRVVQYAKPFVLTSEYKYKAHTEGQSLDWKLEIVGGTSPYQLSIDWGDGTISNIVRHDQTQFTISHVYTVADPSGVYDVVIKATDARGATTILQLAAVVRGGAAIATGGPFAGLTDTIRRWLWVIWPTYMAVVLMAISFWIGEREAYQRFMARRKLTRPHARRR